MIKVLGMKRVLVLVILASLNIAMGASVYGYLIPQTFQKETDLANLRGQVSVKRDDIDKIRVDMKKLMEQQTRFQALEKRGFFGSQDRRAAELVFEDIQKKAGVISAVANVSSAQVVDDPEAAKAEYKLLKSPVKVEIESLNTVGVYRYIYLLQQYFPGQISIADITLKRNMEISGATLQNIENGENPAMVRADIDMIWHTMIKNSDVINAPTGQMP